MSTNTSVPSISLDIPDNTFQIINLPFWLSVLTMIGLMLCACFLYCIRHLWIERWDMVMRTLLCETRLNSTLVARNGTSDIPAQRDKRGFSIADSEFNMSLSNGRESHRASMRSKLSLAEVSLAALRNKIAAAAAESGQMAGGGNANIAAAGDVINEESEVSSSTSVLVAVASTPLVETVAAATQPPISPGISTPTSLPRGEAIFPSVQIHRADLHRPAAGTPLTIIEQEDEDED